MTKAEQKEIEDYINKRFKSLFPEKEIKEKEWEALSWDIVEGKQKIYSAKRLSDNEVFSIGDEISYWAGWGRIRAFEIDSDNLKVCLYMNECYRIDQIQHYIQKPKEEQLFQSKDDIIYKIATIINAENALPENNIFDKSEKIYALFESQFKASKTNSIKEDSHEENAFNAARLFDKKDTQFKYKTFQDYKKQNP